METRDELSTTCNPKVFSRCLSVQPYITLPHRKNDDFLRAPEIGFRYEIKARKVIVDFQVDVL